MWTTAFLDPQGRSLFLFFPLLAHYSGDERDSINRLMHCRLCYRSLLSLGRDGVHVGQALIDAGGIVGQVTRDQHFSAEAMLVTDADHAVPVQIGRNQLRTIAVGTGDIDLLALPFLPRNADVKIGDLLISSGLGGTFPPGYPVATVVDVRSIPGQAFLEVDAKPSAALNSIREVLLIWREDEETPEDPDQSDRATIAQDDGS